jgi:ATP-dependent Zn protease
MTDQERLGAAYHEAGHAVVASALGLSVERIEIGINGDDAKGATDVRDAAGLPLVDRLAICAAGIEAQKIFEAPTHDDAGLGDYGKMFELLDDFDDAERRTFIEAGHQRACELVRLHPHAVERVARALLAEGKIERAAARELLVLWK